MHLVAPDFKWSRWWLFLPFVVVLGGCRAVAPERSAEPPPTRVGSSSAEAMHEPVENAPTSGALAIVRANGRVAAIGDTHGDLDGLLAAMRLVGAIDEDARWVGGDLHVVLVGDVLDRGDDEPQMFESIRRWRSEAADAGGALHMVLGNHEVMNVLGDFRYVTPGGWVGWPDEGSASLPAEVPAFARARFAAFRPGGPEALWLSELPMILRVDDTLFVHGGVLPHHVAHGLGRINAEVRAWLRAEGPLPQRWVADEQSPIWTRAWSGADTIDCAAVRSVLEAEGAARMVVGHTVQARGANGVCDGAVWRIDTGISAHYGGTVHAILIERDRVRVLRP
jgi:hypothetical protein